MAIHEHLPGFTAVTPQVSPGGTTQTPDSTMPAPAIPSTTTTATSAQPQHELHPVEKKGASAETVFAAAQALQQRGGSRARPDILATSAAAGDTSTSSPANHSTPNSPDPNSDSSNTATQIGTSEGARSTPISPVQSILGKFGGVLSGKKDHSVNAPGSAGLANARGVESPNSGTATPPQFIFPKLGSRRHSEHHHSGINQEKNIVGSRRGSGAVSPEPIASGASTPVEEAPHHVKEVSTKSKKKEKTGDHHNPLHDLRRVSRRR